MGRTPAWISFAIILATALAGCLDTADDGPTDSLQAAALKVAVEQLGEREIRGFASAVDGRPLAVVQWSWDDGTSSNANPAVHTYLDDGTYRIVVTATAGNETLSEQVNIRIGEVPATQEPSTPPSSGSNNQSTEQPSTGNQSQNSTNDPPQEEPGSRPFEPREPSGSCGSMDSLTPILPTTANPAGMVLGWELLQLDVVVIADPLFVEANDDWVELLQQLVDDASVRYEAQLGIRLNATLIAALPPGSLQPGTGDDKQRDVARGFMDANYPDLDWDFVAVILGGNYNGSTAGQVECVHGLGYKDYAYLWSEYTEPRTPTPGVGFFLDTPLKVFMHEAAHLLAAHHHYTNCVVPYSEPATNDLLAACGVMINDIGLASFRFSETNKLVMRSYVEQLGVADPV